jgi:MerR family transcriptional regulator/heat shock protein HspR
VAEKKAKKGKNEEKKKYYMISTVSERYGIHAQTLRLYERDGLLKPSRTSGNTRLYSDEDIEKLELILNLTRNLGVNLAGVEIVLNMREKMKIMQEEMNRFMQFFMEQLSKRGITKEEVREAALACLSKTSVDKLFDKPESKSG